MTLSSTPSPARFPRWSRRWLASAVAAVALTATTSPSGAAKRKKKPRAAGTCPVETPAGGQLSIVPGPRLAQPVTLSREGSLRQITVTVAPTTNPKPDRFLLQLVQSSHGVPGHRPQDVIAAAIVSNPPAPGKATHRVSGTFAGPALTTDSDVAVVISLLGDDPSLVIVPGGLAASCGPVYVSIDGDPFALTPGEQQALPFTLTVS